MVRVVALSDVVSDGEGGGIEWWYWVGALSDVLIDGKGGGIRGVWYPIRFNSFFEFWQKNDSFNIRFNIALPKI